MKTLSLIILLFLNYTALSQITYLGYILEGTDGMVPLVKSKHFFSADLSANADHEHAANNKISTIVELGGWTMSSGTGEVSQGSFQLDSAATALIAPAISIDAVDLLQLQVGASNESDILLLDDVIRIDQAAGEVEIENLDRDDTEDDVVGINSVTGKIVLKVAAEIETSTKIFQALGSTIKAVCFGSGNINNPVNLADNTARYSAIWLDKGMTATGVKWYQATQGSYTADQNNYVGLYSYSGGTLTQVAISANNGDIWKATANTVASAAFGTPYSVTTSGVYFIGILYNQSAQVTAPAIGIQGTSTNLAVQALDFTNSAKMHGTLAGQNSLPTPQVMSGVTSITTQLWLAIY